MASKLSGFPSPEDEAVGTGESKVVTESSVSPNPDVVAAVGTVLIFETDLDEDSNTEENSAVETSGQKEEGSLREIEEFETSKLVQMWWAGSKLAPLKRATIMAET